METLVMLGAMSLGFIGVVLGGCAWVASWYMWQSGAWELGIIAGVLGTAGLLIAGVMFTFAVAPDLLA